MPCGGCAGLRIVAQRFEQPVGVFPDLRAGTSEGTRRRYFVTYFDCFVVGAWTFVTVGTVHRV